MLGADVTITYIGEKVGLYTGDGPAYSGEVIFDNLRVPENIYSKTKYAATVLEFKSQKLKVPPRKPQKLLLYQVVLDR